MTGEKMNKIYAHICLGTTPELNTDEERKFYNELLSEIQQKEKAAGKPIQWAIPAE